MITLALQIFLLLLSAFLVGCMAGCLLRRSFHEARSVPADAAPAPHPHSEPLPAPRVPTPESSRFETALTGGLATPAAAVHREPVVEVRPKAPPPPAPGTTGRAEIEIVPARERAPRPSPVPPPAPVAAPAPPPARVAEKPVPQAPPPPGAAGKAGIEIMPARAPAPRPAPPPAPPPVAAPVKAPASVPEIPPRPAPPPRPAAEAAPSPRPAVERERTPPAAPPGAAVVASYAAVAVAAAATQAARDRTETADREPKEPTRPAAPERTPVAVPPDAAALANYAAMALAAAAGHVVAGQTVVAGQDAVAGHAATGDPQEAARSAEPLPAADDLKRIRGIERVVEGRLNALGVRRFADIAGWTADDVARVSDALGFGGRIEQENWIEQAQILERGGDTDFSHLQQTRASAAGMAAATAAAAATAVAHQSAGPDRFTRIIGIDPETEEALYRMGYTRFSEIAHWTTADVERVEHALGRPGRIGLDNWVEQARVLARYAGETEPRPVKLTDAIRETRETRQPAEAASTRTDLAGMRSIRSEALRGDAPAHGGRPDDLKRIRGIGVLIEKRLNALGVVSYEQIANWTGADIDSVSTQLDFRGRIERENWIEQARILASGGQTEFSRRVDRGEVD